MRNKQNNPKQGHTFLGAGQHPTECSNGARARDDSIEIYRPAEVCLDRIRGRDNQVMMQIVVSRVHQQGVVHQRQDNDGGREDLTM